MRAICPISGIPFRTYDSLPVKVYYPHPIFSLTYDQLIYFLDIVRKQEEEQYQQIENVTSEQFDFNDKISIARKISNAAVEAIHEKNWNNPIFKLYQTKHLVFLAFMKHAELLENEKDFIARPSPQIIEAYFWSGVELFVWACTIRNPNIIESLPKYRVSAHNEDMKNLSEYLDILTNVKTGIGERYRSRTEENKLISLQRALSILAIRRNVYNKNITAGNNKLAATWALMVTRAPKDMYKFWFAILASPSTQITFEGVKIDDKYEIVTAGDLRELKDFLEDNLIGPRGEQKQQFQKHEDDSEHYFVARQTVLGIIRKHIAILEQGTAGYQIVNAAMGAEILSSSDDQLELKALEAGLDKKPSFADYPRKIDFIKKMATWRHNTKQLLLDLNNLTVDGKVEKLIEASNSKEKNYEIL